MNAKNVKVITKDGRVTLRGPVNTAEENVSSVKSRPGSQDLEMWITNWK